MKYWQINMNNVKMYQAHKDAVRGIRLVYYARSNGGSAHRWGIMFSTPYTVCLSGITRKPPIATSREIHILPTFVVLFYIWTYSLQIYYRIYLHLCFEIIRLYVHVLLQQSMIYFICFPKVRKYFLVFKNKSFQNYKFQIYP